MAGKGFFPLGTRAVLVNCFGLESSFVSNSDKFSLFSLSGTESIHHVPRSVPRIVSTHLEGPVGSKFCCQLAEDADKPDGGQTRCSVGVGQCMSTRVTTPTREGGGRKGKLYG